MSELLPTRQAATLQTALQPKIKKIVWGTIATVALTAAGVMGAKAIFSSSSEDADDSESNDDITEEDVYETWADQLDIPEEER